MPQLSEEHIRGYLIGKNSTNGKLCDLSSERRDELEEDMTYTERLMNNRGSEMLDQTQEPVENKSGRYS